MPRSAFKDDLLYTINGALTIFQASRNNAVARLTQVLDGGIDPGSEVSASAKDGGVTVKDPVTAITVEAVRDAVRTYLIENFAGHKLTSLVAAILQAEGFTCDISPPGPDYGVDILAGCGSLGLDSPTLVVEVKSESTQESSRGFDLPGQVLERVLVSIHVQHRPLPVAPVVPTWLNLVHTGMRVARRLAN